MKKIAIVMSNYSNFPDGISVYKENILYYLINKSNFNIDIFISKNQFKTLKSRLTNYNFNNNKKIKIIHPFIDKKF